MTDDNPIMKWLWPILASLAGSVTAQSMRSFRGLSPWEIAVALFVGASFSIFVTPLIIHFMDGEPLSLYVLGGIYYVTATSWNAILPWLIRRITSVVGPASPQGVSSLPVNHTTEIKGAPTNDPRTDV